MALEAIYSCGTSKHIWRLSTQEVEALEKLRSKGLRTEVDTLFSVEDFGQERVVLRQAAYNMSEFLISALRNRPSLAIYGITGRAEIPRGSGNYSAGAGDICGLKIGGETYDVEFGLDKCVLVKKWQGEQLEWHDGAPVDASHLNVIETDPDSFIGNIKITRRNVTRLLVGKLTGLRDFLENCTDDHVFLTIS